MSRNRGCPTPKEPAVEPSSFAASFVSGVEQVGQWIGPYHLVRILGEGGMGIVYLAQQEHPIRRQVALKVIKPGMDSRRIIHRFRTEEQTLALLHHPNIALVLDAGTTDAGRSYFVMEYVEGIPITDYCDRHALTVTDRLSLFQQVCHGIHHAHQKGIVHRDIKPSNVLVCVEQDMPIPKIIDFGIAKAISRPVDQQTWFTRENQPVGTPEFMSPEQLEMAGRNIDIRSDIYSLGVLLYVLLTGVRPFDWENLRAAGIDHIRRIIREQDPKTPSTRITRLGPAAAEIANCRHTEVHTLIRRLRRELEWIPLKAMRKERVARYRSAAELADDIDNYLRGRPLLAGPPTTIYRLKKFVRRHRTLVIGVAAVLAVSLIGTLVSAAFAIQAQRARDDAQAIAHFLEDDVLGSVSQARVGEATVSYGLNMASEKLDEGKFKDKPLIEASIRETLAWTYRHIGEPEKAEQHWLKAIELYQQYRGEDHADTLRVTDDLGWAYEDQGRYHDMERLWTRNLQIRRRVSGAKEQLGTMNALAVAFYYVGKYDEAESLFKEGLELIRSRLTGGDHWLLPWLRCNLARVYTAQGRYKEAERLFADTFQSAEWPEPHHSAKFMYTSFWADTYREQGRYKEAELLFVQALGELRLLRGNKHVRTLRSTAGLECLYIAQGRFSEAEDLLDSVLGTAQEQLRKEHPITLAS